MLPLLQKTNEFPAGFTAAYIVSKDTILPEDAFSKMELEYVKSKIADGSKSVTVNSYSRWSFIVVSDPSEENSNNWENLRNEASRLISALRENKITEMVVTDLLNDTEPVLAFTEGLLLAGYRFDKYMKEGDRKGGYPAKILVKSTYVTEEDLLELGVLCKAVFTARDLVNEPLSYLTAVRFAAEIEKLGEEAGFSVEVFDKAKLEELGMGGILSVNRGSVDPPTFSVLEWKPEKAVNNKPVVLVGKGVVYDTGGISLKPTYNSMDYMKSDMAGAASVAGIMYAVSKNRLPVHIIGLIPATDNRPDGNAIVPGDVVKMYDETTVEVLNTDAEGRMLLADALSYAARYEPSLVIDLATLTGSAQAALGTKAIALMRKTDDKILQEITESGMNVHERVVEFPLWDDYKESLKSDVAELKNIGGRTAGTITAGKFLEHFISYPWIHLDIAGPAFLHKKEGYRVKGGSGVGVRLIYDFLKHIKQLL